MIAPELHQWADDGGPVHEPPRAVHDEPLMPEDTHSDEDPQAPDMRAAAKAYLAAGYEIVPLLPGSKATHDKGWPKKQYGVDAVRPDSNLGVKCLEPVIDIDCVLPVRPFPGHGSCADDFLPITPRMDGRPGKPRSHRTYKAEVEAEDFKDLDGKNLVQILVGRGKQVVVPPSLWVDDKNPQHQERRAWVDGSLVGPPAADVEGALLRERVVCMAAATLIARYWPPKGIRRELRLAYARVLLEMNIEPPIATRILEWACRLGGSDEEGIKHAAAAVRDTREALDKNEKAIGATTVAKLLPDGEKLIARLREWYGIAKSWSRVGLDDFYAYMPDHDYLFLPTREFWPASSVNVRIPPIPEGEGTIPASLWLDRHRSAEQMTWAPGAPLIIQDRLVSDGGWVDRVGCSCVNLYRPPTITGGDATQAHLWFELLCAVYPHHVNHIVSWLAHRVQRPQEKLNHALVLGGPPGIGKDTILEPVKAAVGPWNFVEVSPTQLLGRFNGFAKSVILRVSEARDLGDTSRYVFYEHMKVYAAAPPDVLRVDEKNLREHAVFNVCGVVITTNHETDGIYLPEDDRRHFVAWSPMTPAGFPDGYWKRIYGWYANGGAAHVAAFLAGYDLSAFDPKAPPPKTETFWAIVNANRTSEDAELADVLEACGEPRAVTLRLLIDACASGMFDLAAWLGDRRNSRAIPHRMKAVGYEPFRNAAAKDGLWKIEGRRQVVYVQQGLSVPARQEAAEGLARAVSQVSEVNEKYTRGKPEM